MTSCCLRRRMRWSGATGAIARCKNRSTGYVRKPRSAPAWHWTCGEKPKGQDATKPSIPYMRHVLPEVTRYLCYSFRWCATTHNHEGGTDMPIFKRDDVELYYEEHRAGFPIL